MICSFRALYFVYILLIVQSAKPDSWYFHSPTAHLFTPLTYYPTSNVSTPLFRKRPLIASPEEWIQSLSATFARLDHLVIYPNNVSDTQTRARRAYLEMLSGFLLGLASGPLDRKKRLYCMMEVIK